ncbi:MAG: carboxypeptidase regulatory-like domain-containing protein, partial [Solirubrobacterales bacterium]|nr:carboxypeptidase regulatory-like domain-containing protein [Solirubrobacterales bacterium]
MRNFILVAVAGIAGFAGCAVGATDSTGQGSEGLTGGIAGRLTNGNGGPIAGATVQIQGYQIVTTMTDANGNYALPGLATTGHTVTATLPNCTFSPASVANVYPGGIVNFRGSGSGCP